jgi:hypothetical protein
LFSASGENSRDRKNFTIWQTGKPDLNQLALQRARQMAHSICAWTRSALARRAPEFRQAALCFHPFRRPLFSVRLLKPRESNKCSAANLD